MISPESQTDLEQRIARVVREKVALVPYDECWAQQFRDEKHFLLDLLPLGIIRRIEHFGSTAVPGLAAKPIIDLLIEVSSLEETKAQIVPLLTNLGYEYFWRPEFDEPPSYAWFIKRAQEGHRTHHLHLVEADSKLWERLSFRDYLREFPEVAAEYERLKLKLEQQFSDDRVAYTRAKGNFIIKTTIKARDYYFRKKKM